MKVPFKLGEYLAELIGSGWFIYNEKGERFSISYNAKDYKAHEAIRMAKQSHKGHWS